MLIGCLILRNSFYKSLRDDIAWLRAHPLIKSNTVLTGLIYDIDTGKLEKVSA